VRYHWIRSNGTSLPTETVTFTGSGIQQYTTTSTWAVMADGNHWQAIQILSPRKLESRHATFTLDCQFA